MKLLPNIVLLISLTLMPVFSQQISHEVVKKGIETFYMADFEEAMRLLQSAIINEILSDEEEFYAHLYVGFCHIRQNSDMNSAELYFQQAVKIDPEKELDPNKIPPDLLQAYESVKKSMLGTIIIDSEPSEATAMLIDPSSNNVKRGKTPVTFTNLPANEYQVLVSMNGHETYSSQIAIQSGITDSLKVTLLEKDKSFFMAYWPYGAGALAASAAIFAITSGGSGGDEPPTSTTRKPLPQPPQRP